MTSSGARRATLGTVAVAVALLASAPVASAAITYCVGDPSCSGTAEPDLPTALTAADGSSGRDTIQLGSGPFTGPAVDIGGNPVDIIGKGDATVLSGGATVLNVQDSSTVVSALRIDVVGGSTTGLMLAGIATGVSVTGGDSLTGVRMVGSSDFKSGRVTVGTGGPGSTAIAVDVEDPAGVKTVTRSTLEGTIGFRISSPLAVGSFTNAQLLRVRARQGIDLFQGQAFVDDVVLNILPKVAPSDLPLALNAGNIGTSVLTARNISAYGPSTTDGSAGAIIIAAAGSIDIHSSVLRHFTSDLYRTAGTLTADYSDFLTSAGTTGGTNNTSADPQFLDPAAGDLRPGFPSPLVDAGDPAALTAGQPDTDLDGNARVVNGRVDMGAFEYQRRAPTASFTVTPASGTAGTASTFDGSGSSDPDPGDTLTYLWAFDDGASESGAVVSHAFATAGAHSATLTVTDPAGLTGSATQAVSVAAAAGTTSSSSSPSSLLPPPPPGGPSAAVTVDSFTVVPSRFKVTPTPTATTAAKRKKAPNGTTMHYHLSGAASVRIAVDAQLPGRTSGRNCVRPSRALRKARRCTRSLAKGSLRRSGTAGDNTLPFSGRIGTKALGVGTYRATIVATDAAGRSSSPRIAAFTVVGR